ncbi:MAG TPA: glycosyltransferase family 2 protein [Candidatus Atribacteria bacterium]|nr:glycosyltransferase family 2 protein [Candidatus Atribacteria bacterium]
MLKNPVISIIIPTYNRAHLIDKAIKSVLNQTYQNYEIMIVDDGSTDNTKEVVKGFADSRINYFFHTNNLGVSAARNTGIKASRGEYIAFLDSDDEWLPEKLNRQIKIFKSESSVVGVVYTGIYYSDEKGKKVKKVYMPGNEGYIYEHLLKRETEIYISTVLLKNECFTKAGLFDADLFIGEDYDMWLRIAKYYKFRAVKELLVVGLIHDSQTSANSEVMIEGVKKFQKKYSKELRTRPYSNSTFYFYLGNKFCHLRKIREGQKYFIKAVLTYPFCPKYYIYLLCSIFGSRGYMHISHIRRYFMNMRKVDDD